MVYIEPDDIHTPLCETQRNAGTDARCRARNNRYLIFEQVRAPRCFRPLL